MGERFGQQMMNIPLIQDDPTKQRIIVMGGSFNPPTLAHYQLMISAINAAGAERGLFVPADQEYVQRKMKRLKCKREVLSEETRLDMLLGMCHSNPKLYVDPCEYGQERGSRTFETMERIQQAHPEAELWFVAGGDKLPVIPRWHRSEDFMRKFRILVVTRDGFLPNMADNPFLEKNIDAFRTLPEPQGIADISSTRVRDLLRNGNEAAAQLVHPAVWDILVKAGWLKRDITNFRGHFEFLSNFYEAPIEYGGLRFGSGEAAFQAQKCMDAEGRQCFQALRPAEAKRAGRRVTLRPDWEQVKVALMEEIVRAKFFQNEALAQMLLATEDRLIQEGNTWHDTFWGVDQTTKEGENNLGKILMKIRQELHLINLK